MDLLHRSRRALHCVKSLLVNIGRLDAANLPLEGEHLRRCLLQLVLKRLLLS